MVTAGRAREYHSPVYRPAAPQPRRVLPLAIARLG